MKVLLALDSDEAGQRAVLADAHTIADLTVSWGTPRHGGPTAQALAVAQNARDVAAQRWAALDALDARTPCPSELAAAHHELEVIGDYLVDLYSQRHLDRQYLLAQTTDEYISLLTPHRVVDDVNRIDFPALKARLDIRTLAEADGAEVKPAGGSKLKACCTMPDHSEKTPSMWLYPESQSFYCFGCHLGGDTIDYLRKTNRNLRDY